MSSDDKQLDLKPKQEPKKEEDDFGIMTLLYFNNNSFPRITGIDVDAFLRVEAASFNQNQEVDRILSVSKQTVSPIEILNLPKSIWYDFVIDISYVKKDYRKKSLLLHPGLSNIPLLRAYFF